MARRVIGYAKGRPLYQDEGPARAHGVTTGLASIAGPKMPDRLLVGAMFASGGAGEVERRQINDDERAARAARDDTPSLLHRAPGIPSPARPHNTAAQSRARGAARASFTPGATKPYLTSPASRETGGSESAERAVIRAPVATPAVQDRRTPSRELPGVIEVARRTQPITAVTPSPLEEGSMVAAVTAPPASNGHVNILDSIPGNYSRRKAVDVVTPCDDCGHAPIWRIRPLFEELVVGARFADAMVDPAIRIVAVSVECEYFLDRPAPVATEPVIKSPLPRQNGREGVTPAVAPDDAPTPPPVAARPSARGRGGSGASTSMPAYVRRMVDAMVEAKGDRPTAARTLGIKLESLVGSLSAVRARTDLTAAERAAVAVTRRSPGATA